MKKEATAQLRAAHWSGRNSSKCWDAWLGRREGREDVENSSCWAFFRPSDSGGLEGFWDDSSSRDVVGCRSDRMVRVKVLKGALVLLKKRMT